MSFSVGSRPAPTLRSPDNWGPAWRSPDAGCTANRSRGRSCALMNHSASGAALTPAREIIDQAHPRPAHRWRRRRGHARFARIVSTPGSGRSAAYRRAGGVDRHEGRHQSRGRGDGRRIALWGRLPSVAGRRRDVRLADDRHGSNTQARVRWLTNGVTGIVTTTTCVGSNRRRLRHCGRDTA